MCSRGTHNASAMGALFSCCCGDAKEGPLSEADRREAAEARAKAAMAAEARYVQLTRKQF